MNKLKIKEFSLLCQVSVKTLRHYEKVGLLKPNEVDEYTGYRYYDVSQMQRLINIKRLKAMGFSLDEIATLTAQGNLTPSIQNLKVKIENCKAQLEQLTQRLDMLNTLVDSQNKLTDMEKFSIQSLPSIIVASHREVVKSYAHIGRMCYEVIGPEMARLGCVCPEPGYCFTVEHNEYRPTDIDIEYCEQVTEMGRDSAIVQFKQLPAVERALCMKHYGPYEKFYESFIQAFQYMEQHDYIIDGQPRTVYIDGIWNQEDPNKWLSIIQIPIK